MTLQRKILLVEDDSADAVLIRRALEKTGVDFTLSRLKHGDGLVPGMRVDRACAQSPELLQAPSMITVGDVPLPRQHIAHVSNAAAAHGVKFMVGGEKDPNQADPGDGHVGTGCPATTLRVRRSLAKRARGHAHSKERHGEAGKAKDSSG